MSAGLDAPPGRRAAPLVATLGLCAGGICLLAGAAVYLGAVPDVLLATWAETRFPAAAKDLTLAAVVVLGTILVSVGAAFALLERTGVLAALTVPRHGVETLEPRDDLPAPKSRHGAAAPARSSSIQVPAPASDHGTGRSGAGYAEPGSFPSRWDARDVRPDFRTGGVSRVDTPGAVPSDTGEPPETHAAEPGSAEMAGDEPEVQRPEAGTLVCEAAAPQLEVGEPPSTKALQPGDLIAAWENYRRDGDGHFSRHGLQGVLDQRAFEADVSHGDQVAAGGAVLIVETPSSAPRFYVLPSFNKSPRAVAEWFDDNSGGALTGRTQRVARVAQGRWVETGNGTRTGRRFEVIERGEVT